MHHHEHQDLAGRVVVTGIGMITPLGAGKVEFAANLFAGKTGVAPIQSFDTTSFSSHLGAEVTGFNPRDFISVKNLRRMDKTSLFTAAAARLALQDAGLDITPDNRDRVGIVLGTAFGATDVTAQFSGTLMTQGPASVNPILVPNIVMNAPAGHASIELGFRGVNTTVTHFAVSAETAIAYAAAEIRRGTADYLLAGGVDILSKFYYESLTKFRALSPQNGKEESCRPFDTRRNGTVVGEGSGILLLESLQSALSRGRVPYCEIKGVGMGASPTPPTAWPAEPSGIKKTLQRALESASLRAGEIQSIFAAANGDRILDETESLAYEDLLADVNPAPRITAVKGATGESFSSGGIRACALALAMEKNSLPPSVGLTLPLSELPFVREREKADLVMTNAALAGISFGGSYVYLIFGK
jgi:3-oxoacyl-[acyl-carrier-protein] synthase II